MINIENSSHSNVIKQINNANPANWNIVAIEDSETDLDILKELLNQIGVRDLKAFQTAEYAIENHDAIQHSTCVLLDNSLPLMNGLECLNTINEMFQPPPVIMLTGCSSEKVAVEALKNGARDYVVKDGLSQDGLQRAISNGIEKHALEKNVTIKNQESRDFASIVAHDLQSSLRVVLLASEVIEEQLSEKELDIAECEKNCHDLRFSANYMKAILDGLVGYLQHGNNQHNFKKFDLNKNVATLVSVIKQVKNAEIIVAELPEIFGDPIAILRVFQNLIENGLKYNKSDIPTIKISYKDLKEYWEFSISDNGIGVKEKFSQKIFEPLIRLHGKKEFSGTGIGLALVKKIVNQHGGEVWVESVNGNGSCFKFTIPKLNY